MKEICFALLIAASPLIAGCQEDRTQAQAKAAPPDVVVQRPLVKRISDWDEFTGRFEAVDDVAVRARVSGYLQSIHFRDGETVKQDQLLFVIDPRPYQAALTEAEGRLAEAKSRLTLASRDLERAEPLRTKEVIPQTVFDQRTQALEGAQGSIVTAEAQVERARLELGYTRITAPMSGRISRHAVSVGNLIDGGQANSTLLTSIVTIDPIEIAFNVDEQTYWKYQKMAVTGERPSSRDTANPVRISLFGGGPELDGRMSFVDNRVDQRSGTIMTRAIVPNPDGKITPGMFARVRLLGSGEYNAILVPDLAIGTDQTTRFVYVVVGGRVEVRPVQLGPLIGDARVIRSGVGADDEVVVTNIQRVKRGEKVQSVERKAEQAKSTP